MAVEKHDGGFTVTGPDVHTFHLLRLAHAVALEVNTGMKMSAGSALQAVNRVTGKTARTKRAALADLVAHIKDQRPDYEPSPSIVKALAASK